MIYFIPASSPQWCLTHMNDLLETVDCPHCQVDKVLHLTSCCDDCRDLEIGETNTNMTSAMTSCNQRHSGAVLQWKVAPVRSVSGSNSHVIALIMQLLVLLIGFLFGNVLAVLETKEHTFETTL